MTINLADRETILTVTTKDMSPAFACAVQDVGTYYFACVSINSHFRPALSLDRSEGSIRVYRDDALYSESRAIITWGGMAETHRICGLSKEFYSGGNSSAEKIPYLMAYTFQEGDILTLRCPNLESEDLSTQERWSIEGQLKHHWQRQGDFIRGMQRRMDDPVAEHLKQKKIIGENAMSSTAIKAEAQTHHAQALKEFSFIPEAG